MNSRFLLNLITGLGLSVAAFNASAILDNGAHFTPDGQKIVFHSYRDNAGELWIMNKDGSDPQKITQGSNHDRWPTISADGKKIAFSSKRNGNWDVYTVNIDGTDLKQISNAPGNELGGAFSPDGKQIVYAQAGEGGGMMLANADGSNAHKIASSGAWPMWNAATNKILYGKWGKDDSGTYIYDVATKTETKILDKKIGSGSSFSQDGQWVYGLTKALNGRTVFKMRSDGSDFTHVGFTGQMDSRPMVSPDGKELVWGHGRYGDPDIFHAFLDGKKVANLTPNSSWERYVDVNPKTGERVVSSRKSGNAELYLLSTDGVEIKLTHQPSNEVGGRWSADGEQLVYSSNATGSYNVYVMDRLGHKTRQLTFGEQNITATDWSVNGKQIAATVGRWGKNHLVLVDVATGKTTEIKLEGRSVLDGTFTRDGKSLVFAASVEGGFELIARNLHSGKNTVLYSIKGDVYSLSMSPDGSKVAYSSDKDGDSEIFVAKMDGSGISQVTDNFREDNNPRWLSDSKSMVFDSDRYNNFESFKIDVDGSGRVRF